jgi:Arm DNA-binding domain
MLHMKLTRRAVDTRRSDGEEIRLWDASVAGFGVRCRGTTKYYFLKYRLPNGRQRWATIGRHGSPWMVETARKEALPLLEQIVDGEDPVEAKATQRSYGGG